MAQLLISPFLKWILAWVILMFLPLEYSIAHSFRFRSEMYWCQETCEDAWQESSKFCISHSKCAKINEGASEAEHWTGGFRSRVLDSCSTEHFLRGSLTTCLKKTPLPSPDPPQYFPASPLGLSPTSPLPFSWILRLCEGEHGWN